MYRTELITFCGSEVKVVHRVDGDCGKTCFNDYENGVYGRHGIIETRHPNVLRSVITSKKGWGLWVSEWSSGISDGLFTKDEILDEIKKRNIDLPDSMMKELDDSIRRKNMGLWYNGDYT
jgi:hypothetical protein